MRIMSRRTSSRLEEITGVLVAPDGGLYVSGSGVNTRLIIVTIVLTAGAEGPTIYSKRATCEAWMDAGTDIVVEQAADQLVVKDSSPKTQKPRTVGSTSPVLA